jgi:hypothetical protein
MVIHIPRAVRRFSELPVDIDRFAFLGEAAALGLRRPLIAEDVGQCSRDYPILRANKSLVQANDQIKLTSQA